MLDFQKAHEFIHSESPLQRAQEAIARAAMSPALVAIADDLATRWGRLAAQRYLAIAGGYKGRMPKELLGGTGTGERTTRQHCNHLQHERALNRMWGAIKKGERKVSELQKAMQKEIGLKSAARLIQKESMKGKFTIIETANGRHIVLPDGGIPETRDLKSEVLEYIRQNGRVGRGALVDRFFDGSQDKARACLGTLLRRKHIRQIKLRSNLSVYEVVGVEEV